MTRPARPSAGWRMRVPPALLLLISSGLLLGWLQAWGADQGAERAAPWWIYLFLVLMSVAMVSLAAAVTIDPRPLVFRRALAGTALAWTVILASVIAAMRAAHRCRSADRGRRAGRAGRGRRRAGRAGHDDRHG